VSCPRRTFISRTRHLHHLVLHDVRPQPGAAVLELNRGLQHNPELVVPCDEDSLVLMQDLVLAGTRTGLSEPHLDLLERSLGNRMHYRTSRDKRATLELAQSLGVKIPAFAPVASVYDALTFAEQHGYPVVLKPNMGVAGEGIRFCHSEDELAEAASRLKSGHTVNQFIKGKAAGNSVTMFEGRVVEGISYIKSQTHPPPHGPATVLQPIDHPQMQADAVKLCAALGLTGFASPGFMVDVSGDAYLIEMNARAVPATAVSHRMGCELVVGLLRAIQGEVSEPSWPRGGTYMLYPQERFRDPRSRPKKGWLEIMPEDDPELVAAFESYISASAVSA